jgi:hypothetical protein
MRQRNYYPQVSASSSYSRNYAQGGTSAAAPGVTNYNQYQDALSLNQTIFDSGKTSAQVDVQALGADAARADLENTSSQIILGVKQAYYGILQARQSRDAYAEEVVQFQQHLDQAKRVIMLIGIVKKNAIMMIDFALEAERKEGKKPEEAIYQGALIRFRPIMMTTMSALMATLPIALGLGAGGETRQPLGVAVVGALSFPRS